jgi:hypothetical protein
LGKSDKEKIISGLMPYPAHVGSALIKPIDQGKTRGLGMRAMYEQTDIALNQIKKQVEFLIDQAKGIQKRIEFSEKIYLAECRFTPVIGKTYHLYQRSDSTEFLSMIEPNEWPQRINLVYLCSVTLLADHSWQIKKDQNSKPS